MALALMVLRDQLADLTRRHESRDGHGRFAPTGRDNLTHQPLTHEQHAAAIAALDKTKGRGTGICGHCTKLLNGPRKGQHLGVVPIIKGAHYNDALCPSHMHQTLHTFYRNRGLSDAEAHQRAEAQVRAGWSAEDLATLDYTPTPETTSIRLRMGDLLRRRRGGKRPRNKGHHTAKHRPRKSKVKSLKARLAQLKATVPQPKLPNVTNIHGAQGQIIDNIGSGVMSRLAGLGARLRMATVTRGWDVVYDEGKHPRGPNGRYIGGNGHKAHTDYTRVHATIAAHKAEAKAIQQASTKQAAQDYLANAAIDGHVGLPAMQAHEHALLAHLNDVARALTPIDLQEFQALSALYQRRLMKKDLAQTHDAEYQRVAADVAQIKALLTHRNALLAADHVAQGLAGSPPRLDLSDRAQWHAVSTLPEATRTAIEQHLDHVAATTDVYGQTMPFTQADFNAARAQAVPLDPAQQGINEAAFLTIGGTRYVMKTASPDYPDASEAEQHRNEAATGAAMRALGLGHLVPPATYHLVGANGRDYTVVAVVPGRPASYVHDLQHIPIAHLEQAVLAEYLLGMTDRHGHNTLADAATGQVTEIDHAFGFRPDLELDPESSAAWRMLAARTNETSQAVLERPLSPTVVRDLMRQTTHLFTALAPYQLAPDQLATIRNRITRLRTLSDTNTPISMRQFGLDAGTP